MRIQLGWFRCFFLGMMLFPMGASAAFAIAWSDDFADGSTTDGTPVSWLEDLGGYFPGDYNASSGDYVLTPVEDGYDASQMAAFVPVEFPNDVYVRTQGFVSPDPNDPVNNVGGNLVLLGRVNPNTLSGYLVYFDVSGNLNLQILDQGATFDIGTTFDAPFNAGSEVVVELNIIGSELSAYAWAVDDPNGKPATPQVTATDTTFTSGIAGVAFAEDDDFTHGTFRYVSAQDTPFVDTLAGDFNVDGHVDAADYTTWRDGLGTTHTPEQYDIWKQNFEGAPGAAAASSSSVPEPTSMLFAAMAILCAMGTARSRSRA